MCCLICFYVDVERVFLGVDAYATMQRTNVQALNHLHTQKIHVLRCKMGKVSTHNNQETTTFCTAPKKTRLLPGSFICSLEI